MWEITPHKSARVSSLRAATLTENARRVEVRSVPQKGYGKLNRAAHFHWMTLASTHASR